MLIKINTITVYQLQHRIWLSFTIFICIWKHAKDFFHYFCWYELICAYWNKNKDILIFGKGLTQGLDDTKLTAEAEYPINFTKLRKRFVLSLHYNGSNSFLFVNATKIYQFKAKDSEIKDHALCLGNISKDFTIKNMKKKKKKTELQGIINIFFCWV